MEKYLMAVRYGMMLTTENFLSGVGNLALGTTVIIHSGRGLDWGEVVSSVTEVEREIKGLGEAIRVATEDDLKIIKHIREVKEPEEIRYCQKKIQELGLKMRMVGVEHLFGGDRIIFYFMSDGRVDFRELVKDLARAYRTRIEMRQIGVRDEARLLGDFGHCGQQLCCRTFMRHLKPVTMRMAKVQKTTLDPTKISGHCGRLMCCLRFEDEVYSTLRRELPGKGSTVVTDEVQGTVVDRNLIKQELLLRKADGEREWVPVAAVRETIRPGRRGQRARPAADSDRAPGSASGGAPVGESADKQQAAREPAEPREPAASGPQERDQG